MAITGASINDGGSYSPTGGSGVALSQIGGSTASQKLVSIGTGVYADLRTVDFKITTPKVANAAPNGYTQKRCEVFFRSPLALDNGGSTINTVRIQLAVDVETTDTEVSELVHTATDLLQRADFADFWKYQSLA